MTRIVHEITSLSDPRIAPFVSLTESQLRSRIDPSQGIFIAESPKVIHVALDAGYQPISLLAEERHISGDAASIIDRAPDMQVFTGSRDLLAQITGYTLTRGVLCAMRRPQPMSARQICEGKSRVVVIDSVTDTTNIGAIFRCSAALGIDAVLLTPQSCDPLNRRSIRVSMGSVFLVPWAWVDNPQTTLNALGFKTVAMALSDNSVSIDDPALCAEPRVAMIMGTEGDGLAPDVIACTDYVARIPMSHGVDSLNVAAAAAIAIWQLRVK